MPRLIVVSGCSGGGKSSLIERMAARGFATVAEPGRRVIADARRTGGTALPWIDMTAFATRALAMARADRAAALAGGASPVLFDRGMIDAGIALAHEAGRAWRADAADRAAYSPVVFLTPPWPALFAADPDRRHDFQSARAEYDRLVAGYAAAGYRCRIVPRAPLDERADWLAAAIDGVEPAAPG